MTIMVMLRPGWLFSWIKPYFRLIFAYLLQILYTLQVRFSFYIDSLSVLSFTANILIILSPLPTFFYLINKPKMRNADTYNDQSYRMFNKYFQLGFDIRRLANFYKKGQKQVQTKLREEIKKIILDLEGQLLRMKRISQSLFINKMNMRVATELVQLNKILTERSALNLLSYYRNRFNQNNINSANKRVKIEPTFPVSFENRIEIYTEFAQYARRKNLFNLMDTQQPVQDIIKKGFVENKEEICDRFGLESLWAVYKRNKGDLDGIYLQFRNKGMKGLDYEKNVIGFKIQNLKLLGLRRLYNMAASQWMDGQILRWKKFVQCYGDICEEWSPEDCQKLLKIAISNDTTMKDLKDLMLKMATTFISRYEQKYQPEPEPQFQTQLRYQPTHMISEQIDQTKSNLGRNFSKKYDIKF